MRAQPRKILVNLRSVHDEQPLVVADAVDDEVVNHAAALVEHQRVLPAADGEFLDVIGEHPVQPRGGTVAAREKLPHVRNIEDAQRSADGMMFGDDACVLHGHVPTAKADHFTTETDVFGVERRGF